MKLLLTLIAALIIAGCSDKPDDDHPGGAIPQAQLDALNKAKGVESTMMEQNKKTDEAIDAQ